ncbi:MAG TPA: hypothetical protein PKZ76_00160 [Xanthomonadaceae bacterium]|nr:hypothetical protein [Xanthomonadaceae bacterium]
MHRVLPATVTALFLAACTSPESTEVERTPPGPGLLLDAGFVPEADDRRFAWRYTQHAGEDSYIFDVADGVLEIRRMATQPWALASQVLSAQGLEGAVLEFSAELSGSLTELGRPLIEVTGLAVNVRGISPLIPFAAGKSTLFTATVEPGLGVGEYDWHRQSLRFEVPPGATDIEVAIQHGLGGTLRARWPSLVVLERPPGAEEPEPTD